MAGDSVNFAISLQRDVTGYEFESFIYRSTSVGVGGVISDFGAIGEIVVVPTVGITNAATGSMIIGLSEEQTNQLSPGETYRWFLRWISPTDITRTIISGSVTAVAP